MDGNEKWYGMGSTIGISTGEYRDFILTNG